MGCGIGDFARRSLKMPKTQDFWVFILSPGDLDSQRHMGPRLAAQGTLTRSAGDLDSQRQLKGKLGDFFIGSKFLSAQN